MNNICLLICVEHEKRYFGLIERQLQVYAVEHLRDKVTIILKHTLRRYLSGLPSSEQPLIFPGYARVMLFVCTSIKFIKYVFFISSV